MLEVQRIREETRALLEARQPVENQGPVSQAGQFIEGQRVAPVSAKPADVKSARESITPPAPETTGLHLIENRQAQENQGLITQPGRLSASETQATVAQLSRTSPVSGRQEMLSGEPTYLPSEAVIQRNYQPTVAPGRVAVGFNRSEVIPALFDSAIPVSLLNNTSLPGEIYPEVQRLGGNRLNAPLTTTAWANNLAALRNNPGVAAGPAALARQLGDAENSGVDAWITGSGAGVYAAQRRVRRNEVVAAETQDRIFSLSENISTVADFQPQLVKSMALEEVAPLPLTRSQAVSLVPSPAAPVISEVVAGRDTSFNPASDASVRRVLDTTVINSDFAFAPERPAQANLALTPFEEQTGAYQTVIPATNQADPAVTSSNLSQTFLAEAQAGVYAQAVPATGPFSTVQRTNQSLNLQPTALQRVFKRMDFETPGNGNLAENTGLSFGNLPFSYAARPGFRRDRSALADMETSGESPFFVGSYRETGQADFAAQPAREANPENVVSSVYREPVSENTAARVYSETDAAASPAREPFFNVEPGAVANPGNAVTFEIIASRSNSQPAFEDGLAQPAGVTGFEGIAAASGGEVSGVHSSSPVISGEAAGFNQPQYLKNSLEATWLSPENRLFVERLPGGSSALQRLLQAPGQLQSFFELNSAASAIDLPSLRNNPGLSANVARTLEEPGGYSWTGNPALNLVLRRRATRSNQAGSQVEFEGGSLPGNYQGFEPASLAQNEGPSGSLALTQPEAVQRTSLTRTEPSQPVSQASQTSLNPRLSVAQSAQPGIFQSGANQETAARIQRNYAGAVEPGQSNPAGGSFTISGDWLAQLQSRYEGFSVGQLNGPTGLVMRLLTEDGNARQSMNVSNFGTAPAFETGPGFNYAVPPLLWRKVSDYAPESGIFPFPEMAMRSDQSPTYTSPGEVLRAFDREDPVFNRSEEYLAPSERTAESASSARLDLPMLRQTHRLLQRIARLEKTNTSLELAHRMEEAGQATSSVPGLGQFANPMPGALQRINDTAAHLASPETGLRPTAPAPLRMTDVPVNRPTDSRFLEVDPEILEDAAVASPLPEIRTVEVRVPDYREYRTPLETAAARNSVSGPNIGQGEILQPLAIQRKAATNSQAAHYAPLAQPSLHNVLKTSIGKTLDHPVQRRMTNIFGAHFHDVKVHTGDEAAQATRHVGAEAFTLGSDIYFAPGRYQPDTHAGQALIGHELTHVIQQSSLPSLGNGRIPETSSHGQTLEHHAIANEQLILRHLSNSNSDHDHSLSSSEDGRLSFQGNHFSPSYSTASATIERSYQPVAEQYNHPPINPSHLKNDSGSNSDGNYNGDSSPIQRVVSGSRPARSVQRAINYEIDSHPANNSTDVDDIIKQQEDIDQLARKVYQIIRDELMIERERGFGPSNKFF